MFEFLLFIGVPVVVAAIVILAPAYCCFMGVDRVCFGRRASRADFARLIALVFAAIIAVWLGGLVWPFI